MALTKQLGSIGCVIHWKCPMLPLFPYGILREPRGSWHSEYILPLSCPCWRELPATIVHRPLGLSMSCPPSRPLTCSPCRLLWGPCPLTQQAWSWPLGFPPASMPHWHCSQPGGSSALPSQSTKLMWPCVRLVGTFRQWELFKVWDRQQKPTILSVCLRLFNALLPLWAEAKMEESKHCKTCASNPGDSSLPSSSKPFFATEPRPSQGVRDTSSLQHKRTLRGIKTFGRSSCKTIPWFTSCLAA